MSQAARQQKVAVDGGLSCGACGQVRGRSDAAVVVIVEWGEARKRIKYCKYQQKWP